MMKGLTHTCMGVVLLFLETSISNTQALDVPRIIRPPGPFNATRGEVATFTCEAVASISPVFIINGLEANLAVHNFSCSPTPNNTHYCTLWLLAYNNTKISCKLLLDDISSPEVLLRVQGLLEEVSNLQAKSKDGYIHYNWTAPPTLDLTGKERNMWFEISVDGKVEATVNNTEYNYVVQDPDPCKNVTTAVAAVNGAGEGNSTAVSVGFYSRPSQRDASKLNFSIAVVEDKEMGLRVYFPQDTCEAEISLKLDTNESVYIQATPNLAGEGLFTLDDDRVPQNDHYDATVTASNSVGNTTYNGTLSISTFDVHNMVLSELDAFISFVGNSSASGAVLVLTDEKRSVVTVVIEERDNVTNEAIVSLSGVPNGIYNGTVYDKESDETITKDPAFTMEITIPQSEKNPEPKECKISYRGKICPSCSDNQDCEFLWYSATNGTLSNTNTGCSDGNPGDSVVGFATDGPKNGRWPVCISQVKNETETSHDNGSWNALLIIVIIVLLAFILVVVVVVVVIWHKKSKAKEGATLKTNSSDANVQLLATSRGSDSKATERSRLLTQHLTAPTARQTESLHDEEMQLQATNIPDGSAATGLCHDLDPDVGATGKEDLEEESLDNEGETSMPEELKPDVKPPAIKLQGIQEGPGDPTTARQGPDSDMATTVTDLEDLEEAERESARSFAQEAVPTSDTGRNNDHLVIPQRGHILARTQPHSMSTREGTMLTVTSAKVDGDKPDYLSFPNPPEQDELSSKKWEEINEKVEPEHVILQGLDLGSYASKSQYSETLEESRKKGASLPIPSDTKIQVPESLGNTGETSAVDVVLDMEGCSDICSDYCAATAGQCQDLEVVISGKEDLEEAEQDELSSKKWEEINEKVEPEHVILQGLDLGSYASKSQYSETLEESRKKCASLPIPSDTKIQVPESLGNTGETSAVDVVLDMEGCSDIRNDYCAATAGQCQDLEVIISGKEDLEEGASREENENSGPGLASFPRSPQRSSILEAIKADEAGDKALLDSGLQPGSFQPEDLGLVVASIPPQSRGCNLRGVGPLKEEQAQWALPADKEDNG